MRRDVAGGAGIGVVVPDAADPLAALEDGDVLVPGAAQHGDGADAAEAAAHDGDRGRCRRCPFWWGAPLTTPRVVRAGAPLPGQAPPATKDWRRQSWMTTLLPAPPSRTSTPGPPSRTSSFGVAAQRVGARAADEHVGAVAAVGLQADGVGRQPGRLDDVVAAQRVDRQGVQGRLGVRDADRRGQARDGRAAGGAAGHDHVGAVGGVHDHLVLGAVAGRPADGPGQVGVDRGQVGAGDVVDRQLVGPAERVEVDRARRHRGPW